MGWQHAEADFQICISDSAQRLHPLRYCDFANILPFIFIHYFHRGVLAYLLEYRRRSRRGSWKIQTERRHHWDWSIWIFVENRLCCKSSFHILRAFCRHGTFVHHAYSCRTFRRKYRARAFRTILCRLFRLPQHGRRNSLDRHRRLCDYGTFRICKTQSVILDKGKLSQRVLYTCSTVCLQF